MFMLINGECGTIKCPVSTYKLCFSLCPGPVSAGHPDTTGHMHTEPRQGAGDLSKAPGWSKVFTSIVWRWNPLKKNCQFLFKILSLQFSCGSGSMCSVLTHNADRRQWQQVTSISGANHCHIFLTFTTSYFSILNFDTWTLAISVTILYFISYDLLPIWSKLLFS